MSIRMLIEARHREETRVAIVKGNRIEEFDFESEEHKQLKGNIYLAKVTRVEPSLQAAFVDYGGNRHGFLAFSEIHPDYYQIPKEDREALLREEAEHAAEEEALRGDDADEEDDEEEGEATQPADLADGDEDGDEPAAPKPTSTGGGDDASVESLRQRRMNLRRRYKIQDVIRRRQVLLVQVVKEERGNKGAALTTYLSLAGRYCVLMPNTSHGGGISRKISNAGDRKRLKSILAELNLPRTMGCIVRTAGLQRSRDEIRRDFDYLARLWDEIRERTLSSAAPAEIYRDSDLIKRAIRDLYSKDIDEVIVEGEEGYHAARSVMKLLMPAHARRIQPYSDAVPLFQRFGVEDQLAAMYQPVVQLKSGGYIVINPTEALVSIDINSGRSTREHNIEQTALSTNLEAANEIARQLRLRDMAGLIVIDFIDMEQGSNNRKVEKAIKEALKNDRARIQVGRISGFGLFEMSRQRLRTGVLEASTRLCPHCDGSGFIRTASSAGLQALRLLEEEAARGRGSRLAMRASQEATLYVLNRKRSELADIEDRYGVEIEILSDGSSDGARMAVESSGPPPAHAPRLPQPVVAEPDDDLPEEEADIEVEADADTREEGDADARRGRNRRRRRRRGGRREEGDAGTDEVLDEAEDADEPLEADAADETPAAPALPDVAPVDEATEPAADAGDEPARRSRRRRGGRRRGRGNGGAEALATDAGDLADDTGAPASPEDAAMAEAADPAVAAADAALLPDDAAEAPADIDSPAEAATDGAVVADAEVTPASADAPKPRARRRRKADADATPVATDPATPTAEDATPGAEPAAPKPRTRRARAAKADPTAETADAVATEAATDAPKPRTRRRGTGAAAAQAVAEPASPSAAAPAVSTAAETAEQPPAADTSAAGPADAAPATDAPAEAPARRGWWQRTFG